ncbi:RHE_PE00001 family protein [Rhizobium miluonense]|uniref:HTH DNA binding domain-containing protein n=1 Tax=Rhizobium miluonense TaxID=411945 RepID=A0A1C3VIG8_9HYPH|nr:RHE_PE00001 family protein [Rhizobium miluonense]SCB27546.1 HTH DNA binding domain-containing protein [Rhizobium miluonense]
MRYDLTTLALTTLLPVVVKAEDMLARLDERVLRHVVADGFRERGHFFDAAGALWVGGELVHVEDLVLHDARMDARAPTHELTIAHAVLRSRRRLWNADPSWGLEMAGLAALRGDVGEVEDIVPRRPASAEPDAQEEDEDQDDFGVDFAEIDAILARSEKILNGGVPDLGRPETIDDPLALVRDEDWDEDERLESWRAVIREADLLPPVLGAAVLFDAWERLEPLRRQHWLGGLLVSAYLRSRGKVTSHLFCLNIGLKAVRHDRRRASDRNTRLAAFLEAMVLSADSGLKELDRLSLAKLQMELRLKDRRSNSSLPEVIDIVLSRPIVSTKMIARHVGVTPRGALNLVSDLGLREMTGRGRYRGWGVL